MHSSTAIGGKTKIILNIPTFSLMIALFYIQKKISYKMALILKYCAELSASGVQRWKLLICAGQ